MRRKLKSKAGLTVIEMLAATMVLVLLALMMNTGLQMAFNTYETMIAQSELELLLSTAVDTLADDLRYARKVDATNGVVFQYPEESGSSGSGLKYTSGSFGNVTGFTVTDGQIMATVDNGAGSEKLRVLSTGAYGNEGISYKEYEVTAMKITLNKNTDDEITFTIEIKVETTDSRAISAETTVTVRCLNPPADTASPEVTTE